ncbi:MAG: serine O-acetyltransferase [Nitrospirota bacterium]
MIYKMYKLSNVLYKLKIPIIPDIISTLIRFVFAAYIPYSCEIGRNTIIGYGGLGIVVHNRSIIGENCVIGSLVTIGGTSKKYGVPVIGDNVIIGSGAKLIGPIRVGNNVVIGANAVVVKDVPDNCVVGGIPAGILKNNINITNYHDLL